MGITDAGSVKLEWRQVDYSGGVHWRAARRRIRVRLFGVGCQEATSPQFQSMAGLRQGQRRPSPAASACGSCDPRPDARVRLDLDGGDALGVERKQTDGAGR